jgi:hypothetical protein
MRGMTPARTWPLACSLLLACNEPAIPPQPTPSISTPAPTPEPATPATPATPPPSATRTAPAELPAMQPEPPAPTAAPPPGAPTTEGRVADLLAIDDERAAVRFLIPGRDALELWWLALMRRDGSLAWIQPLSDDLTQARTSTGIERVGDTIAVTTFKIVDDGTRVILRGFALADGAPRFTVELGPGNIESTVSDGELRLDARIHYDFAADPGITAELTATGPRGVVWRAPIAPTIPVGHDPTFVGDAVVVRTELPRGRGRGAEWLVFDRATGTRRGAITAEPQSCSDGRTWFILGEDGLLAVDPVAVTTRLVLPTSSLPGAAKGPWTLEDCAMNGDIPVVLAARGHRQALVVLDPASFAVTSHVDLGTDAVGENGFDPLPARIHRTHATGILTREAGHLLQIADPVAGRILARWRGRNPVHATSLTMSQWWRGGHLVLTEHTVAVVTPDTGALEGRAMIHVGHQLGPTQIAGDTLWLPPIEKFVLGRRAPRLVDLAAAVPDAVRDAPLLDAEDMLTAPAKPGRKPCPDPTAIVRGDGIEAVPDLPKVAPARLPTWDLEILREAARMLACAPGDATTRLLAWSVMEDDRPLRNHNALLLVEDTAAAPPRFTVVQVYRHATNDTWNTVGSYHDRRRPVQAFDHRPTRADVDAFLAQSGWDWVDGWGKLLAGNVLDAEWQAAFGAAPWQQFPASLERPD